MGNACSCVVPRSADDSILSRTRTPVAPSFLDIVAAGDGASTWSLEGRLPKAQALCRRLVQLRVDGGARLPQGLSYEDVGLLARTLPQCTALRQLVLVDCNICREAMSVLAPAIARCNALESLDLSSNGLTDSSVEILADALPGCIELQSLGLRENAFGERGVAALASKLRSLRALNLLMLYGLDASSEMLERVKLPRLNLCFNDQQTPRLIGTDGLYRTLTPPRPGGAHHGQLVYRTLTPPRSSAV